MSDSEPVEAERWLTGGTLCIFIASAGFGYGVSLLSYTPVLSVLVWSIAVALLYVGWVLAVEGLVLAVRLALADGPYSQ